MKFKRVINATVILMKKNRLETLNGIVCTKNSKDIFKDIAFEVNKKDNNLFERAYKYFIWWKENYSNFRTNILEKLNSRFSESYTSKCITIELVIDKEKWHDFTKTIKRRLKKNFTEYINFKLQENFDVRCALVCKSNLIKKISSRKEKSPYFRGQYYCKNEKCRKKFSCIIIKKPNIDSEAKLLISYKPGDGHVEKVPIEIRCTGEERQRLGGELVASGVMNIQSDNLLFNQTKPIIYKKIVDRDTLFKIKYEYISKERCSTDVLYDAQAAKISLDNNYLIVRKNGLIGYIQKVSLDPFGFLLISDIQMCIWETIKQRNSSNVIYFDSTGSILKKIRLQGPPFLYSMVVEDRIHRKIIPIAEFVTTKHKQQYINEYLSAIRLAFDYYKKNKNESMVIVTDFSWPLINSVIKVFNNCTFLTYLNSCFDHLFNNQKMAFDFHEKMRTKFYLCSTHFLKLIANKAKKITYLRKNVRKFFIFCFSLIQNSTTVEQVNAFLINIHYIFNAQRIDNMLLYALDTITRELKDRNLDKLQPNIRDLPEQVIRDKSFDEFQQEAYKDPIMDENFKKKIKDSSLFAKFYNNLIEEYSLKTQNQDLNLTQLNEFFCPELFNILQNKLYIIPVWSAIIIKNDIEQNEIRTRLTNNPVENWFKIVKNSITGMRKLYTSELTSKLYKKLWANYLEFYEIKQPDVEFDPKKELRERWMPKKAAKRTHGYYYLNHNLVDDENFYDYRNLSHFCQKNNFDEIFGEYFNQENMEIDEPKLVEKSNHSRIEPNELNDVTSEVESKDKQLKDEQKNKNQLFDKTNYNEILESRFDIPFVLRFSNSGLGCYSNSLFQVFLSLGNSFFEKIKNENPQSNLSSRFIKELIYIIELFTRNSNKISDTVIFRKLVDSNHDKSFSLRKEQDLQNFFLQMTSRLDSEAFNEYFRFRISRSFDCVYCGRSNSTIPRNSFIVSVNINFKVSQNLEESIQVELPNNNFYLCSDCKQPPDSYKMNYHFDKNNAIILRLNYARNNKTKVPMSEEIVFKTDNLNIKWELKAAVKHAKNHYICWRKIKNGWIEISDDQFSFHKSMDLIDVYWLCYQKKTVGSVQEQNYDQEVKLIEQNQSIQSGLVNPSNYCYMNAALQSISHCFILSYPLYTYFNKYNDSPNSSEFSEGLKCLLEAKYNDRYNPALSYKLKSIIGSINEQFKNDEQQDCHEFLVWMLNTLNEHLTYYIMQEGKSSLALDSVIKEMFNIESISSTKCQNCSQKSSINESEFVISLPLPSKTFLENNLTTLTDCLDLYFKDELLNDDNSFLCETCGKKTEAIKSLVLDQISPIFVIHLKRFQISNLGVERKLSDKIHFPIDSLDLCNYLKYNKAQKNLAIYDLFAVCNHIGQTTKGGHYTAFCKNINDSNWYDFDDTNVQKVSNVCTNNAYILFYKRRSY